MRKNLKVVLVGAAMVIALVLTVSHRGPAMLVGLGRPTGAATAEHKAYDTGSSLDTFNKTLVRVHDAYVDPTRIDPKQMLIAALDSVQKHVAEVLVEAHPESNRVMVRVDTAAREFNIESVDAAWSLAPKMAEIFSFIVQNLLPGTDAQAIRDIEYAATNGMLSTLDPHSVLLDPQTYNDMKTSTRGSFGGLGIVIGIRKGALTVIRPMHNTPAWDAGVRRGDRIVRIEKESTEHMALQDAVDRLRGDPGTKVELFVEHETEKSPRHLALTRAEIQVPSIVSRVLKAPTGAAIGYVRLSQFNQKSDEDLHQALEEQARKNQIRGLILDLRGDPGGLLDKAIKVADEFLESGTIVTTVGFANKQREEKRATPSAQPRIPMAVLVDGSSASASEIVAGALKNLDRAVIVGSRTFGKGSVQVLYDNDDGSALKLTIAQYLTPGDVSIQSVGISPDVSLEPMRVDRNHLSLFSTYKGTREQDLDAHLTSQNARSGDKPQESLRYIWIDPRKKAPQKAKGALLTDTVNKADSDDDDDEEPADDLVGEDDEVFVEDYVIQYARDMVAAAHGWRRHDILAGAHDYFSAKQNEQQGRLVESLRRFNVDFSPVDKQSQPPRLVAQITTDKPNHSVKAGETIVFTATVTNQGGGVAGQVRGQLKSDNYLYEDREFVFGRIAPGETRTWSIPVKVPKDSLTRLDVVRTQFFEEYGQAAATQEMQVRLEGLPHPRFAYSYQLIDDGPTANGDGLLQRGESVRLRVNVENVGTGRALKPVALLRNVGGEGVPITVNKGRFELTEMGAKEKRSFDFTFDVGSKFAEPGVRLELQVYDLGMHDGVTDKLTFPIADAVAAGQPAHGGFTLSTDADVRTGASPDSPIIARVHSGERFPVSGNFGSFVRVELEPGRPGFIANASGRSGAATDKASALGGLVWQVTPPILEVAPPPLAVESGTLHVSAKAHDKEQVIDAYVVVSNRVSKIEHRKVFYRSNRKAAHQTEMQFDTDVPLWSGINVVTVVARQSGQVMSSQSLIINRLGKDPATVAAKTANAANE